MCFQECVEGDGNAAPENDEELVRLEVDAGNDRGAFNNEFVMNGKTEEEVARIVKESCFYDSMKRSFKYRQWAEPQHNALEKISRHIYALMTKTRRTLANSNVAYYSFRF